jgi:hypothetical protein
LVPPGNENMSGLIPESMPAIKPAALRDAYPDARFLHDAGGFRQSGMHEGGPEGDQAGAQTGAA